MKILGISAFYHDSAAALIIDGVIVAAAQEERFSRIKNDKAYPKEAVKFCLSYAGIKPEDLDYVAFYDKPYSKFERLLKTYVGVAPAGFLSFSVAVPGWLKGKLFHKSLLIKELEILSGQVNWSTKLLFSEHHLSHAASAFFPSPFERAAVLTLDGVGEWATASLAVGESTNLKVIKEMHFPHSLGLLYSAFTRYTGFKINSGEYKVMGLAPYGEPKFVELIKNNLIDIKGDGSFRLNMRFFEYCKGLSMTNDLFDDLLGGKPRSVYDPITQRDMDLAASIQAVTEEVVIKLAQSIARDTGQRNLCLAGGVALNCVVNGLLLKKNIFDNVWIQPAAGDAGGALGAALALYYSMIEAGEKKVNSSDAMSGGYLGPDFTQKEIDQRLRSLGAEYVTMDEDELIEFCARSLQDEKTMGWYQGRMEFGPRALGARSIIADPRSPKMQKILNLKVKFRESFRPFAPSILREDLNKWFDLDVDSPYMLFVANVKKEHCIDMSDEELKLFGIEKLNITRSTIPAVTHVDYSARIQTVHRETNPRYYALISRFKSLTGCPILVNTSFNVRGEPIVCTPEDAFRCFMGTELDILVVGNSVLKKENQDYSLKVNYANNFMLD